MPNTAIRAPRITGVSGRQTPSSVQITQPTYQPLSPEFIQYMEEAKRLIGGLEGVGKEAQGAYEGLIRGMGGAYGARGSRAAGTARQAALATGFTPLEASAASGEAQNEAMRDYYAMLPALRLQQAEIPGQYMETGAGLWAQLADLYSQASQVPGETRMWNIDYGQPGTTGTTGATPATGGMQERPYPFSAQEMYIRAQTEEQKRLTAAREMMNRMFYGGGLGPVAGGGLGSLQPPQQPERQAAPIGGQSIYPQITQQPQQGAISPFVAGGGRGTRPVQTPAMSDEDFWTYLGL